MEFQEWFDRSKTGRDYMLVPVKITNLPCRCTRVKGDPQFVISVKDGRWTHKRSEEERCLLSGLPVPAQKYERPKPAPRRQGEGYSRGWLWART